MLLGGYIGLVSLGSSLHIIRELGAEVFYRTCSALWGNQVIIYMYGGLQFEIKMVKIRVNPKRFITFGTKGTKILPLRQMVLTVSYDNKRTNSRNRLTIIPEKWSEVHHCGQDRERTAHF